MARTARAFWVRSPGTGEVRETDLPDPGPHLLTPENQTDPSIAFNSFKIAPSACEKIDTHSVTSKLNQEDFTRFLEAQEMQTTRPLASD